jgi:hypothetical protein
MENKMKVYILFDQDNISSVHSTRESAREALKVLKRASLKKVKGIVQDESDCYEFIVGHSIHGDDTVVFIIEEHGVIMALPENIYINEHMHKINSNKISYERVVNLFHKGSSSTEYLVKYSGGPEENPRGTLNPGQEVLVKEDMLFRVSTTGNS